MPNVEILTFSPAGSTLAVRPFCHNEHYWQVYFDANRAITRILMPDQIRRVS
jgi:small conductance mechanosensitive channel